MLFLILILEKCINTQQTNCQKKQQYSGKVMLQDNGPSSEPIHVFLAASQLETLVVDVIVPQTNLFAAQSGVVFQTTKEEVMCFLGINYLMGYHQLPTIYNYWSGENDLSVPIVAENMTRDRFRVLRMNLHFNDNSQNVPRNDPQHDRTFKLTPVIKHFKNAFCSAMQPTEYQAIDEHMIKFKGHNILKQYMKQKPIKWGIKVWCRLEGRKVVIGDNLSSHLSEEVIASCEEYNISLVFLPPNLTHLCQPLDMLQVQHNSFPCELVHSSRTAAPQSFFTKMSR